MIEEDPDSLETLTVVPTEFEAGALVAVLSEAGIQAVAFGLAQAGLGAPFTSGRGVPVQVRRIDIERARLILEQNVADSVDIDWDSADLGEREDSLPLKSPRRMPMPARIALVAAIIVVIVNLIVAAAVVII